MDRGACDYCKAWGDLVIVQVRKKGTEKEWEWPVLCKRCAARVVRREARRMSERRGELARKQGRLDLGV